MNSTRALLLPTLTHRLLGGVQAMTHGLTRRWNFTGRSGGRAFILTTPPVWVPTLHDQVMQTLRLPPTTTYGGTTHRLRTTGSLPDTTSAPHTTAAPPRANSRGVFGMTTLPG